VTHFKHPIQKPCEWVPCHHNMACPQVVDGGDDLQIWRVGADMLQKQSQTTNNGSFWTLGGVPKMA